MVPPLRVRVGTVRRVMTQPTIDIVLISFFFLDGERKAY
jgi:hypothetical protein